MFFCVQSSLLVPIRLPVKSLAEHKSIIQIIVTKTTSSLNGFAECGQTITVG